MEKQKKQLIAMLAVLVVAVVAFFAVSKISKAQDEAEEETVEYAVNDLDGDAVTRLIFTNSTAGTISLSKVGDEWIYEDDKTVDIDESEVESLIGKVAGLTSENKIENVTDLSQYGLDEPTGTIMISDGTNSCTILVGSYNSMMTANYICLESDKTTVYTTKNSYVSAFEVTVDDITAEEETETETETETEALTEAGTEVETETEALTETEVESETEISTEQ
jgi:hypothetical protein